MSDEKITPLFGKPVDHNKPTPAAEAMQWVCKEITQQVVDHGQPTGVAMVLVFEDGWWTAGHACLTKQGQSGPGSLTLCSVAGAMMLQRAVSQ